MFFSDTWTSSLNKSGSGHFKKQWLMKNTEETKEVPDVDEIVREELRNEFIFFWSNHFLKIHENSSSIFSKFQFPEHELDRFLENSSIFG